jgi:hypothetical protein
VLGLLARVVAWLISRDLLTVRVTLDFIGLVRDAAVVKADILKLIDAMHAHVHDPGAGFDAPIPAPTHEGMQ